MKARWVDLLSGVQGPYQIHMADHTSPMQTIKNMIEDTVSSSPV